MIIICTKNCESSIKEILKPLKDYPVILVDCSSDKTQKIAKKFENVTIIQDQGKGLAAARNIGLKALKKGKYVFFLGADNKILPSDIERAITFMDYEKSIVGMSFVTELETQKTYIQKAINARWKKRFKPGKTWVIGTPYIFRLKELKQFMFDEACGDADDADLCNRMALAGWQFYRSGIVVKDVTIESLQTLIERFRRYGKSDYEYYIKYSQEWNAGRKLKSFLHPLVCEWNWDIKYLPITIFIIIQRYIGWLKEAKKCR